jgi:hypothetical protein
LRDALPPLAARAVWSDAVAKHGQGVILECEAKALGDRTLPFLDARLHELFDAAAIQAHDVIVVLALVQFENGHAVLKMMASDEARGLKLGQHAIDRGKANILVLLKQAAVNVLSIEVPVRAAGQNVENAHPGHGGLQAGAAQIILFHGKSPHVDGPSPHKLFLPAGMSRP